MDSDKTFAQLAEEVRRRSAAPKISHFTAQFQSDCEAEISPHCDGSIHEGDEAGYIDNDLACQECMQHQEMLDQAHGA